MKLVEYKNLKLGVPCLLFISSIDGSSLHLYMGYVSEVHGYERENLDRPDYTEFELSGGLIYERFNVGSGLFTTTFEKNGFFYDTQDQEFKDYTMDIYELTPEESAIHIISEQI